MRDGFRPQRDSRLGKRFVIDRTVSAGRALNATALALAETSRRAGTVGVPLSLQAVVELSLDALPDDATRAAFAELGVLRAKAEVFTFSLNSDLAKFVIREERDELSERLIVRAQVYLAKDKA